MKKTLLFLAACLWIAPLPALLGPRLSDAPKSGYARIRQWQ